MSATAPGNGIEVEVYAHNDPSRLIGILPRHREVKVLDEVRGLGGGGLHLDTTDPAVVEDPALLEYQNLVRIKHDGDVVGSFLIESKDDKFVDRGEHAAEEFEIAGDGPRGWLHSAVVYPAGGVLRKESVSRNFSFASERGSWYNRTTWTTPAKVQKYNMDPNSGPFGTAPAQWPDVPDAYWVWGVNNSVQAPAPVGVNYFRYEFYIESSTGAQEYSLLAAGRTSMVAYIDGEQVMEADGEHAWSTQRADFALLPGHHVLAIRVSNEVQGVAGLIAALFQQGNAATGRAAKLLAFTGMESAATYAQKVADAQAAYDAAEHAYATAPAATREVARKKKDLAAQTLSKMQSLYDTARLQEEKTGVSGWVVASYPASTPGWTPGEIMLTLLDEAQDRGVRFPGWLAPSFTGSTDSKGAAWAESLDWSFDVGTEYFDVVAQLEEVGNDLWIDSATLGLHMTAERGADRSADVALRVGHNLTKAEVLGKSELKNALILETNNGWLSRSDSTSVGKYGRIEGLVTTDLSPSLSSTVASKIFSQKAKPWTASTYELVSREDAVPFLDFQPGDWIMAPNAEGDLEKVRVLSLSLAENDDTGQATFAIEFGTIAEELQTRYERWLKSLSKGSLGGSVAVSGPSTSTPGTGVPAAPEGPDTRTPVAPTGVEVRSDAYIDSQGTAMGRLDITWFEVAYATNGTPLDIASYEIAMRTNAVGESWSTLTRTDSTFLGYGPVEVGREIAIRVRAHGRTTSTPSAWSEAVAHVVESDVTPPPVLSAPILTVTLGTIAVRWDGRSASGDDNMPLDFSHIEVSMAGDADTLAPYGTFTGINAMIVTGLPYKVEHFFRLRSVDRSGNASDWSEVASATPVPLVDADIILENIDASQVTIENAGQIALETGVLLGEKLDDLGTSVTDATGRLDEASARIDEAIQTVENKAEVYYQTDPPDIGTVGKALWAADDGKFYIRIA